MSNIDPTIRPLHPLPPSALQTEESEAIKNVIESLGLIKHIEGGYFAEIDRNPLIIPNPFRGSDDGSEEENGNGDGRGRTAMLPRSGDDKTRNASTSIYYMVTPTNPIGAFHRNRGRTVHTVIKGRGRYVLIHADEEGAKKRVETFIVGSDVEKGERPVWIVEGGKFKASFLLEGEEGLLISETVIPGFEYSDHDFLTEKLFKELLTPEQASELAWLVRKSEMLVAQ